MNEVAFAAQQALLLDRFKEARGGAVIQARRRSDRFQPQIDLDRVTLIRPKASAVDAESKALLVVLLYDFV